MKLCLITSINLPFDLARNAGVRSGLVLQISIFAVSFELRAHRRNVSVLVCFICITVKDFQQNRLKWFLFSILMNGQFTNMIGCCLHTMPSSCKNQSSVIRQKGESQNGCFKKKKHAKFSEKRSFLNSWYAHLRVRIRS